MDYYKNFYFIVKFPNCQSYVTRDQKWVEKVAMKYPLDIEIYTVFSLPDGSKCKLPPTPPQTISALDKGDLIQFLLYIDNIKLANNTQIMVPPS